VIAPAGALKLRRREGAMRTQPFHASRGALTAREGLRRICGVLLMVVSLAASPLLAGAQTIGEKVAGISLQDTGGTVHTLEEYSGKILVLEFWSFKCPVALAYNDRLAALELKYRDRGVRVLAVASNKNESASEIKRNAENLKLSFPVVLDPDGAIAYRTGANHTPSVVILDGTGRIRYRGAIDNNKRAGERGRVPYAEQALEALLAGQPLPQPETQASGCGIRR
jgi:peroxiredoxin